MVLDFANFILAWPYYMYLYPSVHLLTSDRRQSKRLLTIDECGSKIARNSVSRMTFVAQLNADQKSQETVFSNDICLMTFVAQLGDKWQSKILFLTILELRSSILTSSIAAYPVFCSLIF